MKELHSSDLERDACFCYILFLIWEIVNYVLRFVETEPLERHDIYIYMYLNSYPEKNRTLCKNSDPLTEGIV